MAVSDAVIGAGSALAGVLVTAVASAWNDGRRRRWEDERRWADRKRERYLDLLGVSRAVILGIRQSGRIQVGNLEQHVSGQLRLRGTLSLDQEFEVGQVALVEQAVRVAYGGWDELQIVAPVAIYRCADEHFRQLAAWRETLVELVIALRKSTQRRTRRHSSAALMTPLRAASSWFASYGRIFSRSEVPGGAKRLVFHGLTEGR
jgi:hypothetical protein